MKMTNKIFCLCVLFLIYIGSTYTALHESHMTASTDEDEVPANVTLFDDPDSSKDRSKRALEPMVRFEVMANRCSTDQPQLMDTYYYISSWTNDPVVDKMFAETDAYLDTFWRRISLKRHRDFKIEHFPVMYGLFAFPPVLPLACFVTAYEMRSRFVMWSGIYKWLGIDYIMRLSYGRHAGSLLGDYAVQRRVYQYGLVDKLRDMKKSDKDELNRLCGLTPQTSMTSHLETLLGNDAYEAISKNYGMKHLNDLIQMFVEDIVVYEIVRQVCIAFGHTRMPQITDQEWTRIKAKLVAAEQKLQARWRQSPHTELAMTVADIPLSQGFLDGLNTDEWRHCEEISDWLNIRFYDYTFRVTFYGGWTVDKARLICESASNQKCTMKNGKLVVVRWKPIVSQTPDYKSITDRNDFKHVTPLPQNHRFYTIYSAPGGLSEVFAASGYLRNLQKRNLYPALVSYVTNDWSKGGTPQQLAKILPIFKNVLSTVVSIQRKHTHLWYECKKFLNFRESQDANEIFDQLETIFFETNTRFERIGDELKPIMTHFRRKYTAYPDQLVELVESVREKLHTYYARTRLYPWGEMSNDDRKQHSKLAADEFSNVRRVAIKLRDGLLNGRTFMETLSNESPMHFIAYLLVRAHEAADLMVYAIQLVFQVYRYSLDFNVDGISGFFASMGKEDRAHSTSAYLDEVMDHIAKYAGDGIDAWHSKLRQELLKQVSARVSDDDANRLARALEEKFPWSKFAVAIYGKKNAGAIIPKLNEPVYGEMFFINPEYSMLQKHGDKVIIVNWDQRSKTQPESHGFGFIDEAPNTVCDVGFQSIIQKLSNANNTKSMFIWRTFLGKTGLHSQGHPADERSGDDRYNMLPDEGTCCGFSTAYILHRASKKCWYPMTADRVTNSDCDNCHYDYQVEVNAIEHHVNDID